MSYIKERVMQLLEYKKIPKEKFFIAIGSTSSNFRGKAAKSPLNSTTIENILSEIPDLNVEWLLTGLGQMLKPAKNSYSQMTEKEIEDTAADTITEMLMKLYQKGEIYPASVHGKIVAEKNEEITKRDEQIAKLQRKIWELQQQLAK